MKPGLVLKQQYIVTMSTISHLAVVLVFSDGGERSRRIVMTESLDPAVVRKWVLVLERCRNLVWYSCRCWLKKWLELVTCLKLNNSMGDSCENSLAAASPMCT